MEFGLAQGLAVDLQYDKRIADQRWQEQQYKRAQAENMAELKAFEDDLDYMNASNSFDHKLIKDEADKTIREIGEIVRNNQDWRYNPEVRRQINEKKKYLKSNQNVIRGMASDENFKKLNDDLAKVAKNPQLYDTGAYQELLRQKDNYIKYGNQNGEEAALKEGFRPFVYDKPEDFVNMSDEGLKTGSLIQQRRVKPLGNGGFQEEVDEDSLGVSAMDFYNRHKRQIDVTYAPKTQQEAINIAKELIRPGVKLAYKLPEVNMGLQTELARQRWEAQKMQMANQQAQGFDAYKQSILSMRENYIEPEALTTIIGTTPEARIYDADGAFKGTTKGRKFIPTGSFQQANDVRMGKDGKFGLASNKLVGVVHGYIEMNEADLDESGYSNDPALKDKITKKTISNAKGKPEDVYLVPAQVHFDPNDEGKRLKFNNYVGMTTKQISALNPLQQIQQQNIPRTVVQNGITYTFNEQTGQYE